MSKYSDDLLGTYVNGLDICNIDCLERDPLFIFEATIYSGDKNMYNLWDYNMKNNYYYVKSIILKFSDDIRFVNDITTSYLSNNKFDNDSFELCVIMMNLSRDRDNEIFEFYDNICIELYDNVVKEVIKNKNSIGMGFNIIKNRYRSKIINDYFAKRFIDEIFTPEYYSVFNNLNIDEEVIDNYICATIRENDLVLKKYVCNKDGNINSYFKPKLGGKNKVLKRNIG